MVFLYHFVPLFPGKKFAVPLPGFEEDHSLLNFKLNTHKARRDALAMGFSDFAGLRIEAYVVVRANQMSFLRLRWKHREVLVRADRNISANCALAEYDTIRNSAMLNADRLHLLELTCADRGKFDSHLIILH